jgi:hypothetical protein
MPVTAPITLEIWIDFHSAFQFIKANIDTFVDWLYLFLESLNDWINHCFLIFLFKVHLHGLTRTVDVAPDALLISIVLPMKINMKNGPQILRVYATFPLNLFTQYFIFSILILNVIHDELMNSMMKWRMLQLCIM